MTDQAPNTQQAPNTAQTQRRPDPAPRRRRPRTLVFGTPECDAWFAERAAEARAAEEAARQAASQDTASREEAGRDGQAPPQIPEPAPEPVPPPPPPRQAGGAAKAAGNAAKPRPAAQSPESEEDILPPADPPARARRPAHKDWNREKMAAFLRELAASQSVSQAARSVGMSRQSAYRLRNRLVGTPFDLGWEVALEAGMGQLAHAVLDRAVNGVEMPHYYKGELVGTHRHFDERLAIWVLNNPWKVGRMQIAREFSAEGWDRLLERIESGSLDWQRDEELPSLSPPARSTRAANGRADRFLGKQSWYAALASEGVRRRAGRYA